MKGDQRGFGIKGQKQTGDITIAHDNFGVLLDSFIVNKIQNTIAAPATPEGDDGINIWISIHTVHIGGSGLIGSGEISISIQEMGPSLHFETKCCKGFFGNDYIFGVEGGACRIDESHRLPRFQTWWFQGGF